MLQVATPPLATPVVPRPERVYRLHLRHGTQDIQSALALRFEVFNLELNEGLTESYDMGLDRDPFDAVCDHLLVEEAASGQIVGTYRMQTGLRAEQALGYYSEREFDFSPYEALRAQMLELGRACIHRQHRNFAVLSLLWSGIARHARAQGVRYLVGCSSLTSQDAAVGAAAYALLAPHLAAPALRTRPTPEFACPLGLTAPTAPAIPRLLSAYLALGACLCGPPAIDRDFRTIDFLTLLDLQAPAMRALQSRGRFI
jgi:putative hemolysin